MTAAKFNFREGYAELEKIVAELESREIDLERDLPKFERGIELASLLQKKLKEIENKVVEIDQRFGADEEK
ncbi:MAG TPA: exodeoxyribonuclease VII small subunit [Candidatus Andersenbacteria bacterium]|nr:exodeoxyribonuclease VII small subunit [Candidatus Andersenbacteria bacterium]